MTACGSGTSDAGGTGGKEAESSSEVTNLDNGSSEGTIVGSESSMGTSGGEFSSETTVAAAEETEDDLPKFISETAKIISRKYSDTQNVDETITTVEYDDYGNKLWELNENNKDAEVFYYDESGNNVFSYTITTVDGFNDVIPSSLEYKEYDEMGNETKSCSYYSDNTFVYQGGILDYYSYDGSKPLLISSLREREYDAYGNTIKIIDYKPDKTVGRELIYEYTYDEEGNSLGRKTYKNGKLTQETVNTLNEDGNRIGQEVYEDGSLVEETVNTYDENGNRINQSVYEDGTLVEETQNTYDSDGNRTSQSIYKNGVLSEETESTYNDEGYTINRVAREYENGELSEETEYEYNVTEIKSWDEEAISKGIEEGRVLTAEKIEELLGSNFDTLIGLYKNAVAFESLVDYRDEGRSIDEENSIDYKRLVDKDNYQEPGDIEWAVYDTKGNKIEREDFTKYLFNHLCSLEMSGTGNIGEIDYSIGKLGYYDIVDLIIINDGPTSIGERAFLGMYEAEYVSIPGTVTAIGNYAFVGCESLEEVIMWEEGLLSMGNGVFENCAGLTTIYLPKSLKYIGSECFSGCTSLTDIYYAGSESDWAEVEIEDGNEALLNATIHFTAE